MALEKVILYLLRKIDGVSVAAFFLLFLESSQRIHNFGRKSSIWALKSSLLPKPIFSPIFLLIGFAIKSIFGIISPLVAK